MNCLQTENSRGWVRTSDLSRVKRDGRVDNAPTVQADDVLAVSKRSASARSRCSRAAGARSPRSRS